MSEEATVEVLASELSTYLDSTRINQVRRAYYYAEQAHEGLEHVRLGKGELEDRVVRYVAPVDKLSHSVIVDAKG